MVAYPIQIPLAVYSGTSERIRQKTDAQNKLAKLLEVYINRKFEEKDDNIQEFLYTDISNDTGYDLKTLSKILFNVDHGDHGITVKR